MPQLKECPNCTSSFSCSADRPGCWCQDVHVPGEALDDLRAQLTGCVCRSCLDRFASEAAEARAHEAAGEAGTRVPGALVQVRGLSKLWLVGGVLLLLVAAAVALTVGPMPIGVGEVARSLLSHVPFLGVKSHLGPAEDAIVWELRAPRLVLAALVGGILALSGSSYQGVFRNPLADPYLLGVAAGAGLGATLVIAYAATGGSRGLLLPLAAFAGAVAGVGAAMLLGASLGSRSSGSLILAGVAVAAFMTAIQTFVQQRRSDSLREVYSWLLGGFSGSGWHEVGLASPYIAVSAVVLLLHRRLIDVLGVGDDEAATLGINVKHVRLAVVIAATMGTAAAVAVSGLIGFVGIIVPHTIRMLVSTSYRAILPLAALFGASFLVLTDVLARTLLSPSELPIGVVTAFFGAPFFALVLRSTREQSP